MSDAPAPVRSAGWSRLVGDVGRPPERSRPVRILVFLTLAFAVWAAAGTGVVGWSAAAAAIVAIGLGTAVADWRREDTTPWMALAATLVTLVLVVRFALTTGQVATPAELRAPMASLLVVMESVRSFAMRTRRDLRFALGSSAALIAVGASMSISIGFGLPLVGWALCAAAALAATHRRDLVDHAPPPGADRPLGWRRPLLAGAGGIVGAAVVGTIVFMVVPAAESSRFLASMANLPRQLPVPRPGGLSNPSLGADNPSNRGSSGDSNGPASSFGYFGFSDRLDTSVRGRPDDTLVMRVRASAPDFWRGQSFDTWDGRTWSISDERTRVLGGRGRIPVTALPDQPVVPSDELIQTYFLEAGGPNVIFAAARPTDVYIPQAALFQLPDGTLRTGVELEEGAIYTVVSRRPAATPGLLRAAGDTARTSPPEMVRSLGTQAAIPSGVAELTAQITADAPTTYDKIMAIERWMGANTEYSLDIPPLPAGADAVEQFLLVDQVGFCEQIATSLVVMLRSQGIPARLAVGYTPGERNPFTGLFEVRAKDAHAWAEVYFPTVGWQAFDPTADVPLAGEPRADAARTGLGSYLARHLAPYRRILIALAAALVALAAGAIAWAPARRVWRRRRVRRAATWAERTIDRLETLGSSLGRPRQEGETSREYTDVLGRTVLPRDPLDALACALEQDVYGADPLDDDERGSADAVMAELERTSR